jgi:hemerythrin superfamily protein
MLSAESEVSMFGHGDSTRAKWGILAGVVAAGAALIPLVPIIRRRAMRVTTILKKDHRMVSGLLVTLENTPKINSAIRRSLFHQICRNILTHERAEDDVLYAAVRNYGFYQGGPQINQAFEGQQRIKDMVEGMMRLDPMGERFEVSLRELKQTVLEHAELEEQSVFKFVESRFSKEQQSNMGERLHERKAELKDRIAA